eukprot:GEMP01032925.1.p2 GENE.GEMP01032925.1~~GEMP01032925.1.p2  ORF type:complete len:238 (+),score=63.66 GEMP01032925.1:1326-2039(+)
MWGCRTCDFDLCAPCTKKSNRDSSPEDQRSKKYAKSRSQQRRGKKTSIKSSNKANRERFRRQRRKEEEEEERRKRDEVELERRKKEEEEVRQKRKKQIKKKLREEEEQREKEQKERQERKRQKEQQELEDEQRSRHHSPAERTTPRGRGSVKYNRRSPVNASPKDWSQKTKCGDSPVSSAKRRKETSIPVAGDRKNNLFAQFGQIIRAAEEHNRLPRKTEENTRRLFASGLRSDYRS